MTLRNKSSRIGLIRSAVRVVRVGVRLWKEKECQLDRERKERSEKITHVLLTHVHSLR